MYIPPRFVIEDLPDIHDHIRACRLANLVTAASDGLIATPLPLILDAAEGEFGTLYGHVGRPNPQWQKPVKGDAMAIFMGPDAYVTPSWYATKQETGKVVPTWNYVAVHAYGPVEFFDDPDRLLDAVTRLTDLYEQPRSERWRVDDAPENFIRAQLRGIVGLRLPITRIEGKEKMSQNRNEADREGVAAGLADSESQMDRVVAERVRSGL
ncbi:FMN-binding negative transcriptional regulator [Flaviflagellibacter deserti]|uniref:FMN-binding negative transcriptional regulator n=1 Tax=Flaviflagellibacter deserti TaxID=2267266 RepID=A0ABV9YZS3_9HYPH